MSCPPGYAFLVIVMSLMFVISVFGMPCGCVFGFCSVLAIVLFVVCIVLGACV